MLKSNLAKELRQRQCRLSAVPRHIIKSLPDDEIIDCYITCSCCGEKQVEDLAQLERIIADSQNADDFFKRCDSVARANALLKQSVDKILGEKGF
jgi:hypothetical protein